MFSKRLQEKTERKLQRADEASVTGESLNTVLTNNLNIVNNSNSGTKNKSASTVKFKSSSRCSEREMSLEWKDYCHKCPLCLKSEWFPIPYACGHVFCFLCVTDVVLEAERCPTCGQPIPINPNEAEHKEEKTVDVNYQWSYEVENVWRKYEEKISIEIEQNYYHNKKKFDLLINGIMYSFDLKYFVQYEKDNPKKRCNLKRELVSFVNGTAITH